MRTVHAQQLPVHTQHSRGNLTAPGAVFDGPAGGTSDKGATSTRVGPASDVDGDDSCLPDIDQVLLLLLLLLLLLPVLLKLTKRRMLLMILMMMSISTKS